MVMCWFVLVSLNRFNSLKLIWVGIWLIIVLCLIVLICNLLLCVIFIFFYSIRLWFRISVSNVWWVKILLFVCWKYQVCGVLLIFVVILLICGSGCSIFILVLVLWRLLVWRINCVFMLVYLDGFRCFFCMWVMYRMFIFVIIFLIELCRFYVIFFLLSIFRMYCGIVSVFGVMK